MALLAIILKPFYSCLGEQAAAGFSSLGNRVAAEIGNFIHATDNSNSLAQGIVELISIRDDLVRVVEDKERQLRLSRTNKVVEWLDEVDLHASRVDQLKEKQEEEEEEEG
uniref:SPX and EXS domain-containing protein 5 n=1 Tax=Anthurium amnicola TaxID=1678845 RepID=A0A1D1YW70_9ARAE